jgi:hypothetical protein
LVVADGLLPAIRLFDVLVPNRLLDSRFSVDLPAVLFVVLIDDLEPEKRVVENGCFLESQ